MQTGVLISLAAYFILMLGIGLFAWKKSTDTSEGYLLAGRGLSPGVAALSAGASDMSGWLLLAVIVDILLAPTVNHAHAWLAAANGWSIFEGSFL